VCQQIVHTCTINLGMIGSALRLVPSSIPTQISNDMKTRYLLKNCKNFSQCSETDTDTNDCHFDSIVFFCFYTCIGFRKSRIFIKICGNAFFTMIIYKRKNSQK